MYTSQEWSEITEAGLTAAPEGVALALGLDVDAMAIRQRRVTYDQSDPVEASTSWFDAELAKVPRLLERSRITEGTLACVEKMTGRKGCDRRGPLLRSSRNPGGGGGTRVEGAELVDGCRWSGAC